MSFICKVCGAVKNGEKQTKVPTFTGCIKHVPEQFEPVKEGKIIRDQLIKTISIKKNNEEVNEDDEPKRSSYAKEKRSNH